MGEREGHVLAFVTCGDLHTYIWRHLLFKYIFVRKLRGEPPEVPVTARPCVGLCYLMRLRGEEMETTTRKVLI